MNAVEYEHADVKEVRRLKKALKKSSAESTQEGDRLATLGRLKREGKLIRGILTGWKTDQGLIDEDVQQQILPTLDVWETMTQERRTFLPSKQ